MEKTDEAEKREKIGSSEYMGLVQLVQENMHVMSGSHMGLGKLARLDR